jgi:phospholipid transport system substrate-binding protein
VCTQTSRETAKKSVNRLCCSGRPQEIDFSPAVFLSIGSHSPSDKQNGAAGQLNTLPAPRHPWKGVIMNKAFLAAFLALVLLFPAICRAATALETVEARTNAVLSILRDPALKEASKEEIRKEKVVAALEETFDFNVLARMTLGRNWKDFDIQQKKTFIDLYKQILKQTYLHHLLKYEDEEIVYEKERELSSDKTEVSTSITYNSQKIPVRYRLIYRNGSWGVYDVIIEGVSLVKNYRTQFEELLQKNTPDELLDILRDKVNKGETTAEQGSRRSGKYAAAA